MRAGVTRRPPPRIQNSHTHEELFVTQAKLYEYHFNIYSTNVLTQNIAIFYNAFEHHFMYLLTLFLKNFVGG
jgi:hypothetical protein